MALERNGRPEALRRAEGTDHDHRETTLRSDLDLLDPLAAGVLRALDPPIAIIIGTNKCDRVQITIDKSTEGIGTEQCGWRVRLEVYKSLTTCSSYEEGERIE